MTPAYIGQVRNGNSNIESGRVSHFKLILEKEKPSILAGELNEIRENAPTSELNLWRRRALDAENRLHEVREGLRALIDKSNPSPAAPRPAPKPEPSSPSTSDIVESAERALASSKTKGLGHPRRGKS